MTTIKPVFTGAGAHADLIEAEKRIAELEGLLKQVREQIDTCKVPSEGKAHDLVVLRKAIQHIDYITLPKPTE